VEVPPTFDQRRLLLLVARNRRKAEATVATVAMIFLEWQIVGA
jgi:hypothetical protein